jgi:mono/diheme cytochrome c family protein
MLQRAALAAVAVASTLVLTMGPALGDEQVPAAGVAPGAPASAAAQATGKAIFEGKGNCASCHGRDAKGTPLGPDLATCFGDRSPARWRRSTASSAAVSSSRRSTPLRLPPMAGARLRDTEIAAVAQYVFELNLATAR